MKKTCIKTIDSKGRVLLPPKIRELFSLSSGDVVKIIAKDNEIIIRKVGIIDYKDQDLKDIIVSVALAMAYIPKNKKIQIIRMITESIERSDEIDCENE